MGVRDHVSCHHCQIIRDVRGMALGYLPLRAGTARQGTQLPRGQAPGPSRPIPPAPSGSRSCLPVSGLSGTLGHGRYQADFPGCQMQVFKPAMPAGHGPAEGAGNHSHHPCDSGRTAHTNRGTGGTGPTTSTPHPCQTSHPEAKPRGLAAAGAMTEPFLQTWIVFPRCHLLGQILIDDK